MMASGAVAVRDAGGVHLRVAASRRVAGAQHDRRSRPLVRRRRAAGGAGRVRRRARERLPPLHRDDAGLRDRRDPHGPPGRPLRHRAARSSSRRSPSASATSWRRGRPASAQFALVQGLVIGLLRQLRHVRPAGGGRLPLVHAPPGHRRLDLRQRQLPGRHRLAADPPALHRDAGMAADDGRRRGLLCPDHAAADPHASTALADRARAGPGGRRGRGRPARVSRPGVCRCS